MESRAREYKECTRSLYLNLRKSALTLLWYNKETENKEEESFTYDLQPMLSRDSHTKWPNAYWSCQALFVHIWTFFSNPYSSTWNFAIHLHKFLPQHYLKCTPVPTLLCLQSLHFPSFYIQFQCFPNRLRHREHQNKNALPQYVPSN